MLAGLAVFLMGAAVALLGFQGLYRDVQAHGHGSIEMRRQLVTLAAAGGLCAAGISLLLWEVTLRYERRR